MYSLHFEDYSLPLFDTESELENAEDYLEKLDDDYMLF